MTPHAVVLDPGGRARPLVRQCSNRTGTVTDQFAATVSVLLQMIDDSGLHGRRLHLVVSDFWARPLVLPLPGMPPTDEDVDVVLQSHYRRTYGDLMDGWRWCWDRRGTQLVAVAWPAAGLAALQEGINQRAGILVSAKPLATDVASVALEENTSSWLAIVERQSVSLVHQQDGVWQDWRVTPMSANVAETLTLQLARETARRQESGLTVTLVDLNGVEHTKHIRQSLTESGWAVRVWAPTQAGSSVGYRLSQAIALD
jgi:hypothetical protein